MMTTKGKRETVKTRSVLPTTKTTTTLATLHPNDLKPIYEPVAFAPRQPQHAKVFFGGQEEGKPVLFLDEGRVYVHLEELRARWESAKTLAASIALDSITTDGGGRRADRLESPADKVRARHGTHADDDDDQHERKERLAPSGG